MASGLDGDWQVIRTGGFLPPLVGVRKRIEGDRGWTSLGPLPGAPFDEEFILSNQSKQKLLDNLKVDFEQSLISIPNDELLISELEAYQYEFDDETRKMKYSAPEGMHDDLVIALALASWGQRGVASWAVEQQQTGSYMGSRSAGSYMRR